MGTSGDIIGGYERGIITPSIDVIVKIAHALNVSIDFLVGKTSLGLDRQILKRLENISSLSGENKNFVLKMVNMTLQQFKTKKAFA